MDYSVLKKSLKMVAAFTENSHMMNNVNEFEKIHNRNLKMLKEHVKLQNDSFIGELVGTIPNFDRKEIQGFIEKDRGEKKITDYA